ncbi:hypothetical protein FACS1894216_19620 [Synergistales bacterium]|nr:hypothetical protein FACS1894216_19620 [Synergistales bacterium]
MKYASAIITRSSRARLAVMVFAVSFLLSCLPCSAADSVARGAFAGDLFTALGYPAAQEIVLPPDVPKSHPNAASIGSAVKYGLLPKGALSPDMPLTRRDGVRMTLSMMGWGFEASLYQKFEVLPDLGGSGDPIFFLAAEMAPPAPGSLLLDGDTPLSLTGRDALLSWARNCAKYVSWNRVLSYQGVDLILYRQGIAAPGVPRETKGGGIVGERPCEPLYIAALAVHASLIDERIAFSEPLGAGKAPMSFISASYGAIGAVNGGFFHESRPLGSLKINGVAAGRAIPGRSAVGWNDGGAIAFGSGNLLAGVRTPSGFVEFTKFNVVPPPNEAALYTSNITAAAMGAPLDAIELVVANGEVTERREASASTHRTPQTGVLIVARGASRRALEGFNVGDKIEIISNWESEAFAYSTNIIQCGPMLLSEGRLTADNETLKPDVLGKRHPRTIMGTDGTRVFWVVIDGRSALHSVGATMDETRLIAKSLSLTNAINMDGGGSSQIIWRGVTVNKPSDGKERPIPYAVLMMPKGSPMTPRPAEILAPLGANSGTGGAPRYGGEFGEWGYNGGVMMDTYDPNQ